MKYFKHTTAALLATVITAGCSATHHATDVRAADEADRVMNHYGVDWVAVGKGEQLDGWLARDDIDGAIDVSLLRPFQTRLSPTSSLKEALDAVITSHTAVAAVFDGDRFLGMISADRISREIVQ